MVDKVTRNGVIHCIAYCLTDGCDYREEWAPGITVASIRKRAKAHVKNKGHSINIETGSVSRYDKE